MEQALIDEFIDAAVNDHDAARRLLERNPALLNARWIHNETLVHFLTVENYIDGVRFLLEAGASVNETNEFGDTALLDAAVLGNDAVAEVLLQYGADPNAKSDTRENVLHAAVMSGNARLVDLLLCAGARADYITDLGFSVVDALPAERDKRGELLAVLHRHGVRPEGG